MVYEWKIPGLYEVPAQEAGEELARIYDKRSKLDAPDIVEESRPESAVLHRCFERRDPVAAELYRQHQARCIINCIVTVVETKEREPVTVRAYQHVSNTYTPIDVVLKSQDKTSEMKQNAMRELAAFQRKYRVLSELPPVFEAIEKVTRRLTADEPDRVSV